MAKVLVVEDDQFFREAITFLLKGKYEVMEAPNGKTAKEILSLHDFDLVISDIQMPGLSGLELMEWSKTNKPLLPFIIMTGFSVALETKSAFDLGAKGFVAKPFKNAELFAAIQSVLGAPEDKFPLEKPQAEYCKVSIDEFVARPRIDFDVFIRLSDTKIIKLAHKGEEIPKDKLSHYKEKGVKHLLILKEDFGKLIEFNIGLAKMIKDRKEIPKEKKMNFMKYAGEVLLEKVFVSGLDKQSLSEAQSFLTMSLETLSENEESVDILTVLSKHSDHIYAHSLGVSLYAVMIGKNMGFESNTVLYKLSIAGLYHDIGKKEIPRELLDKSRHMLSADERKLIESHVVRGQEILMAMNGIPEDVAQIVFEHHEDLAGLGYPLSKSKLELHPLSKIIQAANVFMDLTLSQKGAVMSGLAAVSQMEKVYENRLDPAALKALKALFPANI